MTGTSIKSDIEVGRVRDRGRGSVVVVTIIVADRVTGMTDTERITIDETGKRIGAEELPNRIGKILVAASCSLSVSLVKRTKRSSPNTKKSKK